MKRRATGLRGYSIVLVRDATTGVECHDTVDALWATRIALHEVEYACSVASHGLSEACKVKRKHGQFRGHDTQFLLSRSCGVHKP